MQVGDKVRFKQMASDVWIGQQYPHICRGMTGTIVEQESSHTGLFLVRLDSMMNEIMSKQNLTQDAFNELYVEPWTEDEIADGYLFEALEEELELVPDEN